MQTQKEREQRIGVLFAEASARSERGECNESLQLVKEALQIEFEPHSTQAYLLRANLYSLKVALMLDQAASEADLKDLSRYRTLYMRLGLEDEVARALADYYAVLQMEPGCVEAYRGRSYLYRSIGSLEGFEADNQHVAQAALDQQ